MPKPHRLTIVLLTVFATVAAPAVQAQTAQPAPPPQATAAPTGLSDAELEALVGPIALYPDALVANILPAATVPLDIVAAARYLREQGKKKVEGAPPGAAWDPSVVALLEVPDAIYLLDKDLGWTQRLGDAVIDQQQGVMQAIQRFRKKAYDAGNLQTTEQQIIVVEKETIVVQPAQPSVVYVPAYNPTTVVVPQTVVVKSQPDYTPLITFGVGVAVGAIIANNCDWHHHHVYCGGHHYHGGSVDVNRNVNRNVNRDIDRQGDRRRDGGAWQPSERARTDRQARRSTGTTPSRADRVRSSLPSSGLGSRSGGVRTDPRRDPGRGYPSGSNRGLSSRTPSTSRQPGSRTPSSSRRQVGSSPRSSGSRSGGMFGGYNRGSTTRQNASRGSLSRGGSRSSAGRSSGSRSGASRGGASRGGGGRRR